MSYQTPPTNWLGGRETAALGVRASLKNILFSVRPEEDAVAVDAYLKSLEPVPSPSLQQGALSESAERGKIIFEKIGCAHCHPAPLFTDLKTHEVGTSHGVDESKPIDTPSLIEMWRTGPYLHDGRAASVWDVLRKDSHADTVNKTKQLSDEDVADLAEFLLSL